MWGIFGSKSLCWCFIMRTIKKIVIHHSLTPRDLDINKSISSFNRSHKSRLHPRKNQLWYHIAYHYIISWNGDVAPTRWLEEVWYHAWNLKINKESIWICLTGNFDVTKPSKAQLVSLWKLIKRLNKMFGSLTIHWHREFAPKTCPWNNFDLSVIDEYIMLFYEKLWKENFAQIPEKDRAFKSPEQFIERIKDLSIDDKFSEMTYLLAIIAEKINKK